MEPTIKNTFKKFLCGNGDLHCSHANLAFQSLTGYKILRILKCTVGDLLIGRLIDLDYE